MELEKKEMRLRPMVDLTLANDMTRFQVFDQ